MFQESGQQEKQSLSKMKEPHTHGILNEINENKEALEMDELQTLLEEAWNTEGIEGTSEETKQFWEGILEHKGSGGVSIFFSRYNFTEAHCAIF